MHKSNPYFILASTSAERLRLLTQVGLVPTKVISTDIDEKAQRREAPNALALRLSKAKAFACNEQNSVKSAIILAADTVVGKGRRIIDKANTDEAVQEAMSLLSGGNHRVYTSICAIAINAQGEVTKVIHKIAETRVKFKHLSQSDIANMIATKAGIGKAGGYAINSFATVFVQNIVGQVSTVMGLPMYETYNALLSLGLEPFYDHPLQQS